MGFWWRKVLSGLQGLDTWKGFTMTGQEVKQSRASSKGRNHMLALFARHGLFDLEIKARGDLEVDYHHTVEDIGICLGEAHGTVYGPGDNRPETTFLTTPGVTPLKWSYPT